MATNAINALVEQRAEVVQAHAQASIQYATARQMDAVTIAMQAQVAQGQALPWLLAIIIVAILAALVWSLYQQSQLRKLVVLAALEIEKS